MTRFDASLISCRTHVKANDLCIGGVSLLDLVAVHRTPLFVYDEAELRNKFLEAYRAFGPGTAYATKAFLCKAIARLAYACGLSLDVTTMGEYHVCRSAGVPANRLVLHGNNKDPVTVRRAISEGVQWIVLDNLYDLALVSKVAAELNVVVPILLRVNPGIEVRTHEFIATGNRKSKFGFPLWTGEASDAIARAKASQQLDVRGVHIHIGSSILTLDNFNTALKSVADFVKGASIDVFVVGGGLGVRYLSDDHAPTLTQWARSIKETCIGMGIDAQILAEPGRALVASAGLTLYTVGVVEKKDDTLFVSVDGGMSDNIRPALYGSNYEPFLVRAANADRDKAVRIVGNHCESGDILVEEGFLPDDTRVGDIIGLAVTGAYCYSMASNYNKAQRPAVVFISDSGEPRVVVERESLDELLRFDRD